MMLNLTPSPTTPMTVLSGERSFSASVHVCRARSASAMSSSFETARAAGAGRVRRRRGVSQQRLPPPPQAHHHHHHLRYHSTTTHGRQRLQGRASRGTSSPTASVTRWRAQTTRSSCQTGRSARRRGEWQKPVRTHSCPLPLMGTPGTGAGPCDRRRRRGGRLRRAVARRIASLAGACLPEGTHTRRQGRRSVAAGEKGGRHFRLSAGVAERQRRRLLTCDVEDEALSLQRAAVHELVVEALRAHVLQQGARVSSEARHDQAHVVVDTEALLLVGCELGRGPLQADDDDVRLRCDANARGALLNSLHRVLDLKQAALRAPRRHVRVILVCEDEGRGA
jgi:hypothetical protein